MGFSRRPTLAAPAFSISPDPRWVGHQGDPYGAYGYRMAQLVNGLQSFSSAEAGENARSINFARNWGKDPGIFPDEVAQGIDSCIMPILYQHWKTDATTYNPYNVAVNYLVAYPGLRSWGTPRNGRYPVNVLLTRDLLVGPMGVSANGDKFQAQRKAIDDAIKGINELPNASQQDATQQASDIQYFNNLETALKSQDIVVDQSAGVTSGGFFNQGLGILQLNLTNNLRIPVDGVLNAYTPFNSNDVTYITNDPKGWDYGDADFSTNIMGDISTFVCGHMKAGRVDVYINGIQNLPDEVDRSAQALQTQIDKALNRSENGPHTPVIAQYNVSSKLYYGSVWSQHDKLDLGDSISDKEDCANPDRVTTNQDCIRLMATLNALFRILWSRDYQIAFYTQNCSASLPSEYWKVWKLSNSGEAHLVKDLLTMSNPFGELGDERFLFVPKYHSTFEDDYPKGESQYTNLINANATFTQQMRDEITSLHDKLSTMPVTLHAHSQGAIISAVVQSRLGLLVNMTRETPSGTVESVVDLAKQIDLVTYGGAANMYDWGPNQRYKSYTHHVNAMDLITFLGMNDPFQLNLRAMLIASGAIGDAAKTQLDMLSNIRVIPPKELYDAWINFHTVIYHSSKAPIPNTVEHNMTNGYVGNAMSDSSTLTKALFPNKFNGKSRCMDQ